MRFAEAARRTRVLPVVTVHDVDRAVGLADALLESGVAMVEVTLRTPAALGVIAAIARDRPEMHVGAGTVRDSGDLRRALDAGARFAVSPGFTPALCEAARITDADYIPGAATPAEVQQLATMGFALIKLFPAALIGGTALVSALAPVFPDVRFCPSGGIGPGDTAAYLAHPAVAAVGASWVAAPADVAAADWAAVRRSASRAAEASLEA